MNESRLPLPSTAWGKNPTILVCGHLAEPMAGYGVENGVRIRECWRCGRWQEIAAVAPDVEFTWGPTDPKAEAR